MSLSKVPEPIINAFGVYLQLIYSNPIRTKAISSCVIASLGNIVSQVVAGVGTTKCFDFVNLRAFALFGLVFGGPVPHYFYLILDKIVKRKSSSELLKKLAIERLIFAPFYQFLSLYMLARFEGKNHEESIKNVENLYAPVLAANWKFLTFLQMINLKFVPPMLRVLVVNLIGFFWSIYLAQKRREAIKNE